MEQAVDRSEVGISLPDYPVGVYIVTVTFDDGTSTMLRIVKR